MVEDEKQRKENNDDCQDSEKSIQKDDLTVFKLLARFHLE